MNKIIIFHLDDSKNLRGGERQVLYLAKELKGLGYENYIVARKNSPLEKKALEHNIKTLNIPYISDWDIISAFILSLQIKKIINGSSTIPIIHSHTGKTAGIAILTRLFVKAKVITHRRVNLRLKNFLSKLKYKKSDYVISLSYAIKNTLIRDGIPKEKINLIPSSINLEEIKIFSNKFELSKKYILNPNNIFVGSLMALSEEKDPLNFIKAARIITKKHKDIYFFIFGDGPLQEKCKKLIKELNLEKYFFVPGYAENNVEILNSLDIFVLPSKEEGLGSVLIEAMACGLPIVATNAGGIPELIKNGYNGIIVEKQNPNKLAEGIIKLIENSELRKKISENAKEEAKKYSSRNMAFKTLEVYEKAIKNS